MSAGALFGLAVALSMATAVVWLWLLEFLDLPVEDELAAPPKPEIRRVRAGRPAPFAPTAKELDDVRTAAQQAARSELLFGRKAINPHPKDHPLFVPWAIAMAEDATELREHQAARPQPF